MEPCALSLRPSFVNERTPALAFARAHTHAQVHVRAMEPCALSLRPSFVCADWGWLPRVLALSDAVEYSAPGSLMEATPVFSLRGDLLRLQSRSWPLPRAGGWSPGVGLWWGWFKQEFIQDKGAMNGHGLTNKLACCCWWSANSASQFLLGQSLWLQRSILCLVWADALLEQASQFLPRGLGVRCSPELDVLISSQWFPWKEWAGWSSNFLDRNVLVFLLVISLEGMCWLIKLFPWKECAGWSSNFLDRNVLVFLLFPWKGCAGWSSNFHGMNILADQLVSLEGMCLLIQSFPWKECAGWSSTEFPWKKCAGWSSNFHGRNVKVD